MWAAGNKAQRGFSLVECLTTVSVASILASVSVPNMSGLLHGQAQRAEVTAFRSELRLAHVEAQRRQAVVSMCPLDPASSAQAPRCHENARDWSAGWVLFTDDGERGEIDDDDQVIRVHQTLQAGARLDSTARYLSFSASGLSLNAASNFSFHRGAVASSGDTLLCINKVGRVRQTQGRRCS